MADQHANGFHLPATQKAAQFNPADKSVSINEIPMPTIKSHEILVKIKAASLCHSDLMLFEHNEANLILGETIPFTMGHEACGTIISMGSEAAATANFKPGDRIGWLPIVDCCFTCDGCKVHNLWCETGSPKVQGMTVDGYFQEYAAVDYRNAVHIPSNLELETLAPMFCAGATAFNSVVDTIAELKTFNTSPSDTFIAVVGCGGLGHLGIQYLKAFGYKTVAIDLNPEALEEALRCGADHTFNPVTDITHVQQIRSLAGGKGVHAVINYTNSVPAYTSCINLLGTNGVLMVTGIPQKPLQFSAMDISMNRVRVRGSNNGITPRLERCLQFSAEHGIKPRLERFRLEQVPEMLELMQTNQHKGRLGVVFE